MTQAAVADGRLGQEQAYGAIAPPASKVTNRWNLLLDMAPLTRAALGACLDKSSRVFESACGADAMLCDLSALISDPGSRTQQLHFDTRCSEESDVEEEEEEEAAVGGIRASRRQHSYATVKRLVTGFVALQDVTVEMGPTCIVPR